VGFGTDLIVVHDPNNNDDARPLLDRVNEVFNTEIMTWRNNPRTANVMIIQHHRHEGDLTSHLMQTGKFRHVSVLD
jgi:hypothetical protein